MAVWGRGGHLGGDRGRKVANFSPYLFLLLLVIAVICNLILHLEKRHDPYIDYYHSQKLLRHALQGALSGVSGSTNAENPALRVVLK